MQEHFKEIREWIQKERQSAEIGQEYNRAYHFRAALKHLNLALSHVINYIEEDEQ